MTDQCLDALELDEIIRLPQDDPRRRHVDGCPRCRGLARALGIFLEPGDASDLKDLGGADSELKSRLASVLPFPKRTSPRPGRRIGMAVAAVLALCAVGLGTSELLRTQDGALPETGQYQRGGGFSGSASASATADGVRLDWSDAPPAESIVYIFLSTEMSELGRRESPGALDLDLNDPLARAPFFQALAIVRGDTVGRSGISRLTPTPE